MLVVARSSAKTALIVYSLILTSIQMAQSANELPLYLLGLNQVSRSSMTIKKKKIAYGKQILRNVERELNFQK